MTNKGSKPTSFWVRATLPHARFGSLGVLPPTPGPCHLSAFFSSFLLFFPAPALRLEASLGSTAPGNRVAISQRALGLSGSFCDMSKPGREEKRLVRRWRAMFDLKHRRHGRDRVALVLGSCAGGLIPAGLDLKGRLLTATSKTRLDRGRGVALAFANLLGHCLLRLWFESLNSAGRLLRVPWKKAFVQLLISAMVRFWAIQLITPSQMLCNARFLINAIPYFSLPLRIY